MATPVSEGSSAMTQTKEPGAELPLQQQEEVVIRFAGDSGDGMQITGHQFTNTSAIVGNDLATLPDFPAEIRAPAGTRPGVSGFQIHFASADIHTPGDAPDVLVAMNPAALVVNLSDLKPGGMVIVNTGNFKSGDMRKARLERSPLEDGTLSGYRVIEIDINERVAKALEGSPLSNKEIRLQELLHARAHVLALQPAARADDALARGKVREEAGSRRGEPESAAGGLQRR
jgi:2-oxoglutarate ferredoxin oxidoreductase subunit alpha